MDEVGKRSLAHAAKRLASSRLAALLVGGEVEGDEENQVRAENSNTGEGSELLASASTGAGHRGEVSRGEVGVRGEVNEAYSELVSANWSVAVCVAILTKIDDELDDLETSNPLLPPDADTTSTLEVVPVHDNVHGQVKGDGNP